jgi:small-conductance mechanosensitive channel
VDAWRNIPEWLAVCAAMAAGILAGWLGGHGVVLLARAPLRRGHFPKRAASRLLVPVGLLIGTWVATLVLDWADVSLFDGKVRSRVVLPFAVVWLALIAIDLAWGKLGKRHARERPGLAAVLLLVRRVGKVTVIVAGCAVVLGKLGVSLGGFFVATGVVGAAVAFAARGPVENLFAFIGLLVDPPFIVGDQVRITHFRGGPETVGRVQRIGLQSTVIQVKGRSLVSFPNALLSSQMQLENLTARDRRRLRLSLPLPDALPSTRLEQLCERLEESVEALPQRDRRRPVQVWLSAASGDTRLELEVWMRTRDQAAQREAESRAIVMVREACERFGGTAGTPHRPR